MKILKYFVIIVLILIISFSVYLATLEGSYDVKRSKLIKAKPTVVFNEVNNYKNWKDWGPWYEQDSTIQATYPEKTTGEGASYSWTSDGGDGSMETIKVDALKRIDQIILFKTPFGDMKSDVYWTFEKVKGGTNLTWGMKGKLDFIWRFMVEDMVKDLGAMEERGLELLEANIEKDMKVYTITPNGVVDYGGGFYLYNTTSCKIEEIPAKFPGLLMKNISFIRKNKIRTTGGSFSLYHKYDEVNGTTMFSVCYPVAERIITPKGSDVLIGFMKSGKYYKTTLQGSYENSRKAWETAMSNVGDLKEYKMLEHGEPFEFYVNSPIRVASPADLITEIYIPVKKLRKVPPPPKPEPFVLSN